MPLSAPELPAHYALTRAQFVFSLLSLAAASFALGAFGFRIFTQLNLWQWWEPAFLVLTVLLGLFAVPIESDWRHRLAGGSGSLDPPGRRFHAVLGSPVVSCRSVSLAVSRNSSLAREMDWLAGSRLHLMDVIVTRGLTYVPIFALGFSERAVIAYVFPVAGQATFIHSNVRWEFRPLRKLVATPAFHHLLPSEPLAGRYGLSDGRDVPTRWATQFVYPLRKRSG